MRGPLTWLYFLYDFSYCWLLESEENFKKELQKQLTYPVPVTATKPPIFIKVALITKPDLLGTKHTLVLWLTKLLSTGQFGENSLQLHLTCCILHWVSPWVILQPTVTILFQFFIKLQKVDINSDTFKPQTECVHGCSVYIFSRKSFWTHFP